MPTERTSCVHRGSTFFGDYTLLDNAFEATIQVCYKGDRLEAKVGRQLAELVAHDLLHELVVQEAVAVKVAEAEKGLELRVSA